MKKIMNGKSGSIVTATPDPEKDPGLFMKIMERVGSILAPYMGEDEIRVLIYGASQSGILTALAFVAYPFVTIAGFVDAFPRDSSWADVVSPGSWDQNKDIDLVVVASSPRHYDEISAGFLRSLKRDVKIEFLYDKHPNPMAAGDNEDLVKDNPRGEMKNDSPIIIATLPKSGTWWLTGMLRLILARCGFNYVSPVPGADVSEDAVSQTLKLLSPGEFTNHHFQIGEALRKAVEGQKVRVIYLYRDPRDQMTSLFFYHKYCKQSSGPLYLSQSYLSRFSDHEGLLLCMTGVRDRHDGHPLGLVDSLKKRVWKIVEWTRTPGVCLVRYEDLIRDTPSEIFRILDFLGVKISAGYVEEIIRQNEFSSLTGRNSGSEDLASHRRKGVSGDWKNHFAPIHKKIFKSITGEALIHLGYERDNDW